MGAIRIASAALHRRRRPVARRARRHGGRNQHQRKQHHAVRLQRDPVDERARRSGHAQRHGLLRATPRRPPVSSTPSSIPADSSRNATVDVNAKRGASYTVTFACGSERATSQLTITGGSRRPSAPPCGLRPPRPPPLPARRPRRPRRQRGRRATLGMAVGAALVAAAGGGALFYLRRRWPGRQRWRPPWRPHARRPRVLARTRGRRAAWVLPGGSSGQTRTPARRRRATNSAPPIAAVPASRRRRPPSRCRSGPRRRRARRRRRGLRGPGSCGSPPGRCRCT